jgi:uncharacterized protein involved in tellurium resistance
MPMEEDQVTLTTEKSSIIERSAPIQVTLKWRTRGDLDLYCFYVTVEDETGKIYHNNMGDAQTAPHIYLDKDSRKTGAETVTIADPNALKYVLAAAYREFDSGAGSFASADARAVVSNAKGQTVEIVLEEDNEYAYWVALALLDFTDPAGVRISKSETYAEADVEQAPVLNTDGSFRMGAGAVEFKEAEKKCFVATGVYGAWDAPEVQTLRRFRDRRLSGTPWGDLLLRFYYRWSPSLAAAVSRRPGLKNRVRDRILDPLVRHIDR